MNPSSKVNFSIPHLKTSTDSFCDIAHPYRLFKFQYMRYDDSVFGHNLLCASCWLLLIDESRDTFCTGFPFLRLEACQRQQSQFYFCFLQTSCHTNPDADK